ncbi:MAG: hypothetical protein CMF52_04685 [Legionellales bacterium]|nr:hypothetical protein [Legionellales bacterium]
MNCYEGEKYLSVALRSVLSQTYSNWEIIFWDNCSNDMSWEIARSFGPKIRLFRSAVTTSLGEARRLAVSHARGEWLAFLDVDDIWHPEKLVVQMEALSDSDHILGYAGIEEVDHDLKKIRTMVPKWDSGYSLEQQLYYFEINLVTSMVKKSVLDEEKINFDGGMQASEEYNLFMRLLPHGSVHVEKKILAKYRVYAESLTYKKLGRWALERRETLRHLLERHPHLSGSEAYQAAHRQADYYEACALMSRGEHAKARELLATYKSSSLFFFLYVLAYFPSIWRFVHHPNTKKKLTSALKII